MIFCRVLSKNVVTHLPEDFARYGDSNIRGVSVLFRSTSEIKEQEDFIRETSYLDSMCTLKVDMVKSFKTKGGIYLLQFLEIFTDQIIILFTLIGIANLVTWLIHVFIWTQQFIMQSIKRVQVVFKAKRALLGYFVHYIHYGAMTNAMITNFVLSLFIHGTLQHN